jgi:hypothetical protein
MQPGRNRRTRRRVVNVRFLTAAVTGLTIVLATSTVAVAAPAPTFDTATPHEQTTDVAALAAAEATGKPVAILDRRTETTEVFREPDGSYSSKIGFAPVRVRQNEKWVDIDTTLALQPDGSIAPRAVPVGLRLSGGGDQPFAKLTEDGGELSMKWPFGKLPKPRLDGDSAVYPEVLPGVDLKVTAKHSGFAEVLVVKTPKAAANPKLKKINFGLVTNGLTTRTDPTTGSFSARDSRGKIKFQSGTAFAWSDAKPGTVGARSARADAAADAGTEVKQRLTPVKVEAKPGTLSVSPAPGFLDAPAAQFPLVIDPEFWASTNGNWTTIVTGSSGQLANSSFWNGLPPGDNGNVKVGRVPGDSRGLRTRSLFRMDTNQAVGKIIERAEFWIWQKHAWNCASRPGAQLMKTDGISPSTTWNSRPGFDSSTARTAFSAPCPNNWHKYEITDLIQRAAASGWRDLTFGLQAQDENNEQHWRRYNGDGGSPQIYVRYRDQPQPPQNRAPDAPADLSTVPATPCRTGADRVKLGPGDLKFSARLSDPDGDNINGFLDFYSKDAERHHPQAPETGLVSSGTTVTWTVPAGTLRPNVVYEYLSRSNDGKGFGAFSHTCEFEIDLVAPANKPTVDSAEYPADPDRFFGSVGRTGTFTIDRGGDTDVTGFLYSTQDPPTTPLTARPDGTATVKITPERRGPNTLYVRSVDGAGNRGPVQSHTFNVRAEAAPTGWWAFDEASGSAATDSTDNNRALTADKAVSWVPARPKADGNAVSLSGGAHLSTVGPVVDARKSFAVAAWVRPTRIDAGTFSTIISQGGERGNSFALRTDGDGSRWTFTRTDTDTDNADHTYLHGISTAKIGEWAHVAGVYDEAKQTMTLYVNGVPEASIVTPFTGFAGTGPLTVGRHKWNGKLEGPWTGDIDDALVWDRMLGEDEVLAIASGGMGARVKVTQATGSEPCIPEEAPDRAVDGVVVGDPRAKWCSKAADKWLQLKLDRETTLTNILVRHASSGGEDPNWNTRDYDVQTSTDGITWTTSAQVRGNTAGVTNSAFATPVRASFVRLAVITPEQVTQNVVRIFEVGVYGTA